MAQCVIKNGTCSLSSRGCLNVNSNIVVVCGVSFPGSGLSEVGKREGLTHSSNLREKSHFVQMQGKRTCDKGECEGIAFSLSNTRKHWIGKSQRKLCAWDSIASGFPLHASAHPLILENGEETLESKNQAEKAQPRLPLVVRTLRAPWMMKGWQNQNKSYVRTTYAINRNEVGPRSLTNLGVLYDIKVWPKSSQLWMKFY